MVMTTKLTNQWLSNSRRNFLHQFEQQLDRYFETIFNLFVVAATVKTCVVRLLAPGNMAARWRFAVLLQVESRKAILAQSLLDGDVHALLGGLELTAMRWEVFAITKGALCMSFGGGRCCAMERVCLLECRSWRWRWWLTSLQHPNLVTKRLSQILQWPIVLIMPSF